MAHFQTVEIQIPVPWGFIAGCWFGDIQRRPILAIHGWQDNAGSFVPLAKLVATHASILAIDLPGHGRSTHFPAGIRYHTLDFVRIILYVARYYKWPKISLMGHSMGATMCFHFISLFPKQVDMMIAFDAIKTRFFPTDIQIGLLHHLTEKSLIADERILQQTPAQQPPLYTYEKLELLLHEGSDKSVDVAFSKYILDRSVSRSQAQPDKFYFSRDSRVKYVFEYYTEPELALQMAKRIKNVNYLVIKSGNPDHINKGSDAAIAVLRANNPNFQLYALPQGTHHVHLNNADKVAEIIIPFLQKYYKIDDDHARESSKL